MCVCVCVCLQPDQRIIIRRKRCTKAELQIRLKDFQSENKLNEASVVKGCFHCDRPLL